MQASDIRRSQRAWPGILNRQDWMWVLLSGFVFAGIVLFLYLRFPGETPGVSLRVFVSLAIGAGHSFLGFIYLRKRRIYRKIAELPDLDYNWNALVRKNVAGLLAWVLADLALFNALLGPRHDRVDAFLGSAYLLLVLIVLLIYGQGGGSELLILKGDGGTVRFQDCLRPSLLARQDFFYSIYGSYRDGVVIGQKIFPYEEIQSYDRSHQALLILSTEAAGSYRVILYTPRLIESMDRHLAKGLSE